MVFNIAANMQFQICTFYNWPSGLMHARHARVTYIQCAHTNTTSHGALYTNINIWHIYNVKYYNLEYLEILVNTATRRCCFTTKQPAILYASLLTLIFVSPPSYLLSKIFSYSRMYVLSLSMSLCCHLVLLCNREQQVFQYYCSVPRSNNGMYGCHNTVFPNPPPFPLIPPPLPLVAPQIRTWICRVVY